MLHMRIVAILNIRVMVSDMILITAQCSKTSEISGQKQRYTKYFCRYTIQSLCSELKRKTTHFIIVLGLSRLVGSKVEGIGDTTITPHPAICHWVDWPGTIPHLCVCSLPINSHQGLTGGRSASPALGVFISSRHWGCHCWQLSGQMWKIPIPSELQLFLERAHLNLQENKKKTKQKESVPVVLTLQFTGKVTSLQSKCKHVKDLTSLLLLSLTGGSVGGLFPLRFCRVYLQEKDFLEWKKKLQSWRNVRDLSGENRWYYCATEYTKTPVM